MGHPGYTKEEIAARGKALYEQKLRAKVETEENMGKFLIIDIETGEYEMDEDHFAASTRAYRKNPDGARYGMRIGYRSAGTIGASASGTRL